ncbi:uncharacterized protein C2orf92 homolog isoform X1 [Cavia porcellus]|uniref:uncharacterized protein C2orf92 homolog isoform X1 n=1 Tax=Cavia porcellus TaxID=10141 RepID=UPI002FDF6E09
MNDILQQMSPEEMDVIASEKASTTVGTVTKEDLHEKTTVSWNSEESDYLLDRMDRLLDDDLQSPKHNDEPSTVFPMSLSRAFDAPDAVGRVVSTMGRGVAIKAEEEAGSGSQIAIKAKEEAESGHILKEKRHRKSSLIKKNISAGTFRQTASADLPCGQLLHFLQRNIIIVAGILAAIFGLMALLVFVLTSSMRRRQPPQPPANMTYNIFILDEKSWWQKPQESLRKLVENHKQLKCRSSV